MRLWIQLCGAGIVALLTACGQVDPGERAVFVRFGEMDPKCYPEGLYFYNPVAYDMWEIDIKEQKYEVKAEAASKDLQDVTVLVAVNYTIDGNECHKLLKNVGVNFVSRIMQPAIQEVVKANTAKFDAEKIIQERPAVKRNIEKELKDRLDPYGLNVTAVALANISFGKEFSNAIELKAVEQQNVQRKEYERQQAVKEAERQVALARGTAESNRLVRESLNKDFLTFKALDKWDGKLPFATGGVVPFIDIDKVEKK